MRHKDDRDCRINEAAPLARDLTEEQRKRLYVERLDKLQRDIAKLEASTINKIEAMIAELSEEIAANITRNYQIETAANKIAAMVKNLQGQTKETVARIWKDVEVQFKKQLLDAGNLGQEAVDDLMSILGQGVLEDAAMSASRLDELKLMTDFSADLVAEVGDDIIRKINTQLSLGATGGVSPGEMIAKIESFIPVGETRWASVARGPLKRAETIVRTEMGRIYSLAQNMRAEEFAAAGIKIYKVWNHSGLASDTARSGHIEMDGQKVAQDESFINPVTGNELAFPRDPAADASETINCGCYMTIETENFGDLFKE